MILYLWFSRCTFSSDILRLYIPIKQFQAGTKLIYLIVSKIGPSCCQQRRDKAEPWLVPKSGLGKVPPADGAHMCITCRESREHKVWNIRRRKAIIQNHAFGSGVFTLCLLYAIYFPTLKMTVGQICSGMEKGGSCCCRV